MTKLFHRQIDLFATPVAPLALTGAERLKAVALLQVLLTEAVTRPTGKSSKASEQEADDE